LAWCWPTMWRSSSETISWGVIEDMVLNSFAGNGGG
jgi:hypothetical protein